MVRPADGLAVRFFLPDFAPKHCTEKRWLRSCLLAEAEYGEKRERDKVEYLCKLPGARDHLARFRR